jgi:hypothetical protein
MSFNVEWDIADLLALSARVKKAIQEHDQVFTGVILTFGDKVVIFLQGGSGAHRITGRMADTMTATEAGLNYVIIKSGMDYAIYEVNRAGDKDGRTHNWVELGIAYINQNWEGQGLPEFLKWFTAIFA